MATHHEDLIPNFATLSYIYRIFWKFINGFLTA